MLNFHDQFEMIIAHELYSEDGLDALTRPIEYCQRGHVTWEKLGTFFDINTLALYWVIQCADACKHGDPMYSDSAKFLGIPQRPVEHPTPYKSSVLFTTESYFTTRVNGRTEHTETASHPGGGGRDEQGVEIVFPKGMIPM